jgi:guanylate kinase
MKKQNGKCIIFSAPSGAGKTTVVQFLLREIEELSFSISATSRKPRPNETDGKDYYFLSAAEFENKIKADEFLEWEEVYEGGFYGTLKSELERIWSEGKVVIFDLDVMGGTKLKSFFGDDALAIFVQPPNIYVLEERLRKRSTENEYSLRQRIEKASEELKFAGEFDRVLINDNLRVACHQAKDWVKEFIAK